MLEQVENVMIKGEVIYEVRDSEGRLKYVDVYPNTWTQTGVQQIIAWMNDENPNTPAYIGFGSDDGTTLALDPTNTSLGSESSYTNTSEGGRVQGSKTKLTTNFTNDTLQLQATWNFTGSEAVRESGVFDAASGGNMFARAIRASTLNMESGDQLTITWKLYLTIP